MENINFKDFLKLDIRIGTVTKAEVPDWSHWVMKLTVDLGSELEEKIIFAGIMKFFKPEDLIGNQYPFVINLEPKKIGSEGDVSEGMMLMIVPKDDLPAGEAGEETPPILFTISEKVANGSKVS